MSLCIRETRQQKSMYRTPQITTYYVQTELSNVICLNYCDKQLQSKCDS